MIIEELSSRNKADVIRVLDDADAQAVLARLPSSDTADVGRLSGYDDHVVGGFMAAEASRFRKLTGSAMSCGVSFRIPRISNAIAGSTPMC